MQALAPWLLRLPFAAVFLYHGLGKLAAPAEMAAGMNAPVMMIVLVGLAETLAGIGAIVGGIKGAPKRDLVTRLSGLAAAPVMMGAIAMVHWPRWSFTPSETHPMGGMEFQVTMLALAIYFIVTGAKEEA
ncbi:MAG: DoxX family protein [Gemmatimonadales bacterium]|nr:DoxX family protein [Gemmatimonadota bacterium]MCL4212636.1 DoxX family protein [Gemmatimonadales bacterium]